MSANSSSNSSFKPPTGCKDLVEIISTAYCVVYLLLLPLFLLVLYVGYQRWRKSLTSHSDVFTFHMIALDLLCILGSVFYCYGIHNSHSLVKEVGQSAYSLITPGQTLFHIFTCGERYLAVVHPVTYLGLRQGGGVRIRNICIGCVWLISLGSVGIGTLDDSTPYFVFFVISLISVSYFSVTVLRVLVRPGPGEAAGNGGRVDPAKQRAFYTIMGILGALVVRFFGVLIAGGLYISPALNQCVSNLFAWSIAWLNLPSSLVLPLLFLHRAGKLPGCTHNTESA